MKRKEKPPVGEDKTLLLQFLHHKNRLTQLTTAVIAGTVLLEQYTAIATILPSEYILPLIRSTSALISLIESTLIFGIKLGANYAGTSALFSEEERAALQLADYVGVADLSLFAICILNGDIAIS